MAYASFHISSLLDKMSSHDKDFRFMATNDLMMELQKDSIKLDDESERKVIKMLLKLLEDKNGEVQNLAVRCLGPLVSKVKDHQVETIVDTLCSNMISDKEQLRDISSIGLKTVITEFPQNDALMLSNVCKKITNKLTNAISKQGDVSVQLESLDILGDLLIRHGPLLTTFHTAIKDALLPLLKSSRMAVRKRANTAIGHLAISCSSTIFSDLIVYLVDELQQTAKDQGTDESIARMRRTHVQCICAITRQAGHKIGKYLDRLMPLISTYCRDEQIDDELREHCIHTYELFVRRCPMEITKYLNTLIISTCLHYLTYDPNYNYDDGDAFDDEFDDEDDDDYSDDDDNSWKVRRASAKCLEAVVSTRHELLTDFYQTVSLPIIARFKERDESVRTDIFNVFIALVKHTRVVTSAISPSINVTGDQAMETEDSALSLLAAQVPNIVMALQKHLKEKSIKTRHCCFSLLAQLTTTLPGCLSQHLAVIIPGVEYSLSYHRNNSANMKIDALNFLHILLAYHEPEIIHPHIQVLAPIVIECVKDSSYKITSDALLVLQDLVKVICSDNANFNADSLIRTLYFATLHRLKTADIDQEVKERAITCMGQIMSSAGNRLTDEVPTTLELFLERLKNEITRLTAVKSLQLIAQSRRITLSPILPRAMPVLANFLRKNQRSLKISTLRCLDSIFSNYASDVTLEMVSVVLQEVPQLINEIDLHITQLAIQLVTLTMGLSVATNAKAMLNDILPNIYQIVKSPLLHGGALNAVLEFFRILVASSEARRSRSDSTFVTFRDVLRTLIEPIYPQRSSTKQRPNSQPTPLHKQAYHSTAKCVAALVMSCPSECDLIVRQFMMDVENQKSTDSIRSFALLALGEIGQNIDLSSFQQLETIITGAFNAPNEEVKSAASFSLGRVCIGNLQHYLPGMIKQIQEQPKSQYLLLHSLKETISFCSPEALESYMENIWEILFKHAESPEEGTRNVIAECLGKLTLIHPERFLAKLYGFLSSSSKLIRATIITAIKFTITDQPLPIDPLLKEHFGKFLNLLEDDDLNVKRVTLTMLNSAAHNKAILIRDLLPEVLPKLYNETRIRKELIREVMMGPFRHTVDDGLDVRKAAFECMYTLLESSVTQLDIFEFLTYVENGLKDSYDIKMLTSLMLIRLAHLCPVAVLQHVDRLVEPLRATCTVKVKADSVKQEFEKQNELKRSALRVVRALLEIPEADKSPAMSEFMAQVRSSADLSAMFDSIQKDVASSGSLVTVEAMDTS